ncbi:hypothetical protein BDV33DRAFT_209023 [Aspergillus novoparasiticus]|uniref:ATP-grasp domain-containing protein n=1 Tax=Aspergillus novoparasiticus TaxID=986946 RepID=A0A5N6ED11_9EURO|nr:hypothetical protein BDV33DRAFT_209023 [Aspergillus novoparasiticus]
MAIPLEIYGKLRCRFTENALQLHANWTLYTLPSSNLQSIILEVPCLTDSEISLLSDGSSVQISLEIDASSSSQLVEVCNAQSHPWVTRWLDSIRQLYVRDSPQDVRLVLILPLQSGYLVRDDILQVRLSGSHKAHAIFSCVDPGQFVSAMPASRTTQKMDEIFGTAVGGFLFANDEMEFRNSDVLHVLEVCLTLPWVINHQYERRRIALVKGVSNFNSRNRLFDAAVGLRIGLVILDKPGHWLQGNDEFSHIIDEFIPIDVTNDNGLPGRIVTAIKDCSLPIDGISTIRDRYLYATVQAAEMLSFPTSTSKAIELCIDKALMRGLVSYPFPYEERISLLKDEELETLPSPMIIKPSRAGGSFGVFLARTKDELLRAENRIKELGKNPVVEPYLDGPEVDVNIVLQDGKVLHTEVVDNLPTMAEGFPSQFQTQSWMDTGSLFPSSLPDTELTLLRETTSWYLQKMGFRSGVFHCEARVLRSGCTYSSKVSGYPRLTKLGKPHDSSPKVAIIEMNARAPGTRASEASIHYTGVDYYALSLLAALRNDERFRALATPFKTRAKWWGTGAIVAEKGGIFTPIEMFDALAAKSPEIMKNVVQWTVFFKDGDRIDDPFVKGHFHWVAWFLAYSDIGRSDLESIVENVRESLRFSIT